MKIELDPKSGKLRLEFAYRKEMVEAIKSLPDRHYNPNDKSWTVGFDKAGLKEILGLLAGNNWPADLLDTVEQQATEFLKSQPEKVGLTADQFTEKVKPVLMRMGELIVVAYVEGKIDQAEQGKMLDIINHLSLKDFIH